MENHDRVFAGKCWDESVHSDLPADPEIRLLTEHLECADYSLCIQHGDCRATSQMTVTAWYIRTTNCTRHLLSHR
jgi:hypothetical protein